MSSIAGPSSPPRPCHGSTFVLQDGVAVGGVPRAGGSAPIREARGRSAVLETFLQALEVELGEARAR